MSSDEELKARQELINLHKQLMAQYESLKVIKCSDENFNDLIDSIKILVERSADLVAETATVFFPLEPTKPCSKDK